MYMKNICKRFRIFIALTVVLSSFSVFLSSCDKEDGGGSGKTPKREVVNLENYEFTWATPWEWNNYPEAGGSDYGDKRLELYEKVEKDYNCKITKKETNPDTFFEDINRAVMANEKFADFIEVDLMRYQVLMNTKSLQPLSDIKGFNPQEDKFFKNITDTHTSDGKVYSVQHQIQQKPMGVLMFFNKTLIKASGLENPYDLLKNNQWSFDKFASMCKALTKSTSGSTEINQWGFGCVDWHANNFEKPMVFANGGSVIKKNASDRWQFALLDPPAQEALTYLNKLESVDKVMIPPPTGTDASANLGAFTEGQLGFFVGSTEYIEGINKNMTDEWGLLPLPKGPSAKDYVQSDTQFRGWVMLITNKDAEKAATVFNAISDPVTGSVSSDEELFYEDYLSNMLNDDNDALDTIKLAMTKAVPDNSWGVGGLSELLTTSLYACLRSSSVTPKSAMEQIGGVAQGYVEGFFYPEEQAGGEPES